MKWTILLSLWATVSCAATAPFVFMRESDQEKQIILRHGDVETALTHGPAWHLYPDISADGQWVTWVEGPSERDLAVVLYNTRLKKRERFELDRTGMALHPRLTKNGETIFFSAPSSSGNKIMFFSPKNSRSDMTREESDGTRVYRITPATLAHSGSGYFPRPSHDGSLVIFQRNGLLKKEIVEYNRATDTTRVLAEGMAPALSPDETWVLYTSKVQGSWDVWLLNRRTGETSALTHDPKDEMAPTFNSDNRVVFASNRRDERFQLFTLVQGEWKRLVESAANDYAPMFAGETHWQQTLNPAFPAPQRSSLGAISHQGKIYLCGGHAGAEHTYPPESFTDNLQVYDSATRSWKELAPRPHKAHGYQLAARGDYLYAFGGFAYNAESKPRWKSLDVIDRYDIKTDSWQTIGVMPRRRSSNVAVTVGSKVYLIGGWDATPKFPNDADGTFHQAVDVFDLETEQITTAHWSLPLPLRRAFSASVYQGQILLVGGLGVGASHFELLSQLTLIDPESGLARELPPLPFATFAPAAGVLGHELLVFGGMFKTGNMEYEYVSHVYAFDLKKNEWRHTGRFLTENKGFSQVVPFEAGLAVIGGHHYIENRDEPVATVEIFRQ